VESISPASVETLDFMTAHGAGLLISCYNNALNDGMQAKNSKNLKICTICHIEILKYRHYNEGALQQYIICTTEIERQGFA